MLRAAIERGELFSMVFWGPPGCGKTTLARVIATETAARFTRALRGQLGTADVRAAIQGAREARALSAARTILFIDEIHRFNKAQQDALLPAIEDGHVVPDRRDDARTPSSRSTRRSCPAARSIEFEPLSDDDDRGLVERALRDERGLRRAARSRRRRARLPRRRGRTATRAWRSTRWSGSRARDGRPAQGGVVEVGARRPSRTPPRRSRSIYDRAGRPLRQRSRRSSSRCAAATRTRPSTGWPRCSTAARTRSSSPGGCIIFATEDVGNADPQALQVAVAAARGRRVRRHARVPHQPLPGRALLRPCAEEQRRVRGHR